MKTVLFGLDGATYSVLEPLMEQGVMPNLQRFCQTGVKSFLESTPLPITPQAWTTLATGRSMGNHGINDFVRVETTDQGPMLRFNTSRDNHCQTLWKYLSTLDRRVTVLNYFGLAPAEPVNGHTMPGFVPGRYLRRSSYPADLFDRLKSVPHFDVSVLGLDLDTEREALAEMPADRWLGWIQLHIEREQAWFATLEYLMQNEPSDLTAIVFDGVDKLQHLAYRYLDPALIPSNPTPWETSVIELCQKYFRQIDDFLGRTLKLVGPEGRVFIASDHGFTGSWEVVYINKFLSDQGWLRWSKPVEEDQSESIVVERLTRHIETFDWQHTRAVGLAPSSNGVWLINVPPEEYEAFRSEVVAKLLDLRGPDGGQVVTEIKLREEWFAGPFMHRAPDLTLTLRDHGFLSVLNASAPVITRKAAVGTHHPLGILIGHGPGLRQGVTVETQNILDVAPLLAHSVGVDIPDSYEGSFPTAFYEPDYLSANGPRRSAPCQEAARSSDGSTLEEDMDAEDELLLAARLRNLGYIE